MGEHNTFCFALMYGIKLSESTEIPNSSAAASHGVVDIRKRTAVAKRVQNFVILLPSEEPAQDPELITWL